MVKVLLFSLTTAEDEVFLERLRRLLPEGSSITSAAATEALEAAHPADVVVIHAPRITKSIANTVEAISESCGSEPIIVVPPDVRTLQVAVGLPVRGAILEDELERELPRLLTPLEPDSLLRSVLLAFRERPDVPPILSAAVHVLIRQALREAPVGTLEELAMAVGCSSRYLRRMARGLTLDLRQLLALCKLLAAVKLRLGKPTWEAVALSLGYASQSGLTSAFVSCIEHRPTDMSLAETSHQVVESIAELLEM